MNEPIYVSAAEYNLAVHSEPVYELRIVHPPGCIDQPYVTIDPWAWRLTEHHSHFYGVIEKPDHFVLKIIRRACLWEDKAQDRFTLTPAHWTPEGKFKRLPA